MLFQLVQRRLHDGRSSKSAYNIKVATFKEVTNSYTTNDPEDPSPSYGPRTTYTMKVESINYYDMIQSYTMPFQYLWSLLCITEDRGFVFELLRTVYESDIEIVINDNLDDREVVTTNTYTVEEKVRISGDVEINYQAGEAKVDGGTYKNQNDGAKLTDVYKVSQIIRNVNGPTNDITQKYVRTVTNTIKAELARANTWIVDYTKDFSYKEDHNTSQPPGTSLDNLSESRELQESDGNFLIAEAQGYIIAKGYKVKSSSVLSKSGAREWSKYNRVQTVETTTNTYKYEESKKNLREKTGAVLKEGVKESDEVEIKVYSGEYNIFDESQNLEKVEKENVPEEVEVDTNNTNSKNSTNTTNSTNSTNSTSSTNSTNSTSSTNSTNSINSTNSTNTTKETRTEKESGESEENKNDTDNTDKPNTEDKSVISGNLLTRVISDRTFKYKEKNFVTLLLSYSKANSNILNVSSWLFEILETNDATNGNGLVNFVELTKYLLYKTIKKDVW